MSHNKLLSLCLTGSLVIPVVTAEPATAAVVAPPEDGATTQPMQTLAGNVSANPIFQPRDEFHATSVAKLAAEATIIANAAAVRAAHAHEALARVAAATKAMNAHRATVTASIKAAVAPKPAKHSVPVAHYSAANVLHVARRYIGVPYVFGGASFAGIDCSGLVQQAFAKFGIHLPHSAGGQAARGIRVTAAQARPGDLVYFPSFGHIAFWVGPGLILEAAHPGTVVRIHAIWSQNYYIVRIIH